MDLEKILALVGDDPELREAVMQMLAVMTRVARSDEKRVAAMREREEQDREIEFERVARLSALQEEWHDDTKAVRAADAAHRVWFEAQVERQTAAFEQMAAIFEAWAYRTGVKG